MTFDWNELGKKALIGGAYGLGAGLAALQQVDKAVLLGIAVGVIRGIGSAIVMYIESQKVVTASRGYKQAKLLSRLF